MKALLLSVVVPVHNESAGINRFHEQLVETVRKATNDSYEILYCDDGSSDQTAEMIRDFHEHNDKVKLIKLSRNFGKEYALSAGIAQAKGQAILMLDGDGQHPIERIPEFVAAWQDGARVVIGIRTNPSGEDLFKKASTKLYYAVFNRISEQKQIPSSTDFRLIDASVQEAFLTLRENNRLTRSLIDWLGFERAYIKYEAHPRLEGTATYSRMRLIQLAVNSVISLTPQPLYIFGYLGVAISSLAFILGLAIIIEQLLLGDPLSWKFTGTAMLGILIIFLVGIVLMSQAILSLYIYYIQKQSRQRPLYIIDYKCSAGIRKGEDQA